MGVANSNFKIFPIRSLIMIGSLIFFCQKPHGVGNFDRVLYLIVESMTYSTAQYIIWWSRTWKIRSILSHTFLFRHSWKPRMSWRCSHTRASESGKRRWVMIECLTLLLSTHWVCHQEEHASKWGPHSTDKGQNQLKGRKGCHKHTLKAQKLKMQKISKITNATHFQKENSSYLKKKYRQCP